MKSHVCLTIVILFFKSAFGQSSSTCSTLKIAFSPDFKNESTHSLIFNQNELKSKIIFFRVTNCSDTVASLDSMAFPQYEDKYALLFFRVYKKNGNKWYYLSDIFQGGDVTVSPKDIELRPKDSFTYKFYFFTFYNVNQKGFYKVIGYSSHYLGLGIPHLLEKSNELYFEIK